MSDAAQATAHVWNDKYGSLYDRKHLVLDADHMQGHIIACMACKAGLPETAISAEAIINHLKYIRRKQAEETYRLNKIRGAVTDMSKPDIYALSVIIILSIIAVELIRHLM